MNITLDEPGSDNVISIDVARRRMVALPGKGCTHMKIHLDRLEAKLTCKECGKEVNAVEWIALMAEHWSYVKNLTEKINTARAQYEAKRRCRCEHCGKITSVRPATPAQVRAFKRGVKQYEGKGPLV